MQVDINDDHQTSVLWTSVHLHLYITEASYDFQNEYFGPVVVLTPYYHERHEFGSSTYLEYFATTFTINVRKNVVIRVAVIIVNVAIFYMYILYLIKLHIE